MSGKGDKRRPQEVTDDELARRWERTFGKGDTKEKET